MHRITVLVPSWRCYHWIIWLLFSLSVVSDSVTPWTVARQASLYFTISWSLLKLMSIDSVMPSNYLILCHPLLLLPSIIPRIRVFCNESAFHIRWPKYWSFSFSISLSNEYSRLSSLVIDWFDLLAVQRTLKNILQHHSSKASILQCSAFFMVQLLHPSTTTGKTIALTIWTFVGKVASLVFNKLSRFVIAFLPRSKHLLISWLLSPSAVILEPKNKVSHYFHCFPIYLPWSDGTRCHDLKFFECWVLSQLFHSLLSPSSRGSLVFAFCHKGAVICISGYWYFSRQSWFQLVLHSAQHFTWCTLHIS